MSRTVAAALGLLVLAAVCDAQSNKTLVADRYLILTNPNGVSASWRMISFLEQSLTQDGVVFDVEVFDKDAPTPLDLNGVFWFPNGTGKYRGYFMYPNLEAIGDLTKAQVDVIWDYQQKTGVRSAKFGVWITTIGFYPNYDASGSQNLGMSFTKDAPLGTSGVPADAQLLANGLWRTPGNLSQPLQYCSIWANDFALTGIIPPCNATPIVNLNADTALGAAWAQPSVTGAMVVYGDGRETMGFVHDCAAWSATCLTLTHVATDWMASGPAAVDANTSPPKPPSKNVVMDHRVLILTTPGFTNNDFMERTFKAYGTPYDLHRFDKDASPRLDLVWLLWNPDGSGKYSSILMYPNLEAYGHLTKAEVSVIWDYQKKTGARTVKFAAWPTTVGWDVDVTKCSAGAGTMRFTAAAPFGISGIRAGAQMSAAGIYRCPGTKSAPLTTCGIWANDFATTGIIPPCKATSILETPEGVVGTLVKYGDGRESMAFVFDCATWSTSCALLSHLVAAWMSQNILPGQRRALLTVQMDDFFLSTYCSPAACPAGEQYYIASVADMQGQVNFQEKTLMANPNTPPGTDIKLELSYNGNGVLINYDEANPDNNSTLTLDVEDAGCADDPLYAALGCNCWTVGWQNCPATAPAWCRTCTKDYPKPPGTGTDRIPQSLPTGWDPAVIKSDPRAFEILKDVDGTGLTSKFFFSHHTFTHENLDNATTYDAKQQIALNKLMAKAMNLDTKPTYSSKCMVTPQISGLMNGDALAGLASEGLACTTGDNTWAHLKNLNNPYEMLYSTAAKQNYDGFAFLPRYATEIYYNCSTAKQIESVYNNLYSAFYGGPSTINDIVKREAVRVTREGLLALRHDPYMMHQANMRIEADGYSLVSRWLTAVLSEFHSLVSWPVRSLKLDDLYATYKEREVRDACGLSWRIEITPDKNVKTLTVTAAGGGCVAPVTLPTGAGASAGTLEAVGADAPTLRVPLAAGASQQIDVTGLTWSLP